MSVSQYGAPCEPSWESFLGGKTPEPTHVGCPGGSNTPGLIGGWTCPCECHRAPQVCSTEGCERRPDELNASGKCCLTCGNTSFPDVHLATCRRRNGDCTRRECLRPLSEHEFGIFCP